MDPVAARSAPCPTAARWSPLLDLSTGWGDAWWKTTSSAPTRNKTKLPPRTAPTTWSAARLVGPWTGRLLRERRQGADAGAGMEMRVHRRDYVRSA